MANGEEDLREKNKDRIPLSKNMMTGVSFREKKMPRCFRKNLYAGKAKRTGVKNTTVITATDFAGQSR